MSTQTGQDRVVIFDTTLRDGEQSPGASMNVQQKLQVAHALAELGVDVIELGFPVASPGDFEAVQTVARHIQGPQLCALARCNREDIDRVHEALKDAKNRRLHIFLATSPLHREFKLKMTKEEVVRRAVESVQYACGLFDHVQWSAEDAARSELDFLAEVVERVIEAGASTINIPDTVGYAVPSQFATIIAYLKKHVRGIDKVVLSVHCHNDLGLAVANSLGAVEQGARQVECTINGIGERAGNAALEEVVMALRTRHDYFHLRTNIRTERLYPTSRVLSNVTGLQVQRNKAIVGLNAFAHESGIHQHGVLAHRETYEIMRAEDVGFSSNRLVLGKHSGRALLKQRVKELGYQLDSDALDKLFEEVKVLADRKKEIFDADLAALIQGHITSDTPATWTLKALSTQSGTGTIPSAAVSLAHADGRELREAACGDGPVDAVFKALERITGLQVRLTDYQVTAVTEGEEAQGQVTLDVEYQGETYRGMGASTDIILGSAYAFLEVINRIASLTERRATPTPPTADATLKASA